MDADLRTETEPPHMLKNAPVLFRCDAGFKHGLGHLSRCLTLAEALTRIGAAPRFVLNAPEHIQKRVSEAGYTVVVVSAPVGTSDDPASWMSADTRLVVVDSKECSAEYVRKCRAFCPIACFDDEIPRDLPCDVLINNHIWARQSDYGIRSDRKLLIGPAFNTVLPGYFDLKHERTGLLITMGGEDPLNHTAWLIENLASEIGNLPTHVCIGPAHPDPDSVVRVCNERLPAAEIHISPSSLLDLAGRCHIALSAGGTTCYELAAAGIAFAVLVIEEHQTQLAESMVSAGVALGLGRFDDLSSSRARATYETLCRPGVIASLSAAGRALFRHPGASEISFTLSQFCTGRR